MRLRAVANRLILNRVGLDAEVLNVLVEMASLLGKWSDHANVLEQQVGDMDHQVATLRRQTVEQAHRVEVANALLEDMTALAKRDQKTGAWNEVALAEAGPKTFERMRESGKPLSCIFLDLDFFKLVNEEYGHAGGDQVLKEVVRIIGEQSRLSDFTFRLGKGAEEFCVLLPETPVEGAVVLAERIRAYLEKNSIKINGGDISVTASIGVAGADFSEGRGWEDLIHQADLAQKEAKTTRNTVVSAGLNEGGEVAYAQRSPEGRLIHDAKAANDRYVASASGRTSRLTIPPRS